MRNFEIKNQNGRSMIEMLGVLAIVGVLSVGGIAGYSKAMQKYRINKTIEQITLIAGNVRAFFGRQRDYRGLDDIKVLRKAGLLPEEMWTGNTGNQSIDLQNPFGGSVRVESTYKDDSDGYGAFKISYYDIPQDACVELASQDWTNAVVGFICSSIKCGIPPLSVDKAVTACSAQNDNIYIFFYFDVDVNSRLWKNFINL